MTTTHKPRVPTHAAAQMNAFFGSLEVGDALVFAMVIDMDGDRTTHPNVSFGLFERWDGERFTLDTSYGIHSLSDVTSAHNYSMHGDFSCSQPNGEGYEIRLTISVVKRHVAGVSR